MCIDNNGKWFDCNKKQQMKNAFFQVKNAINAGVEVLTGEAVAVDEKIYTARLKVCSNCDSLARYHKHLPKGADVSKLDRCSECGCFVKAKARFAGENFKCPKSFW